MLLTHWLHLLRNQIGNQAAALWAATQATLGRDPDALQTEFTPPHWARMRPAYARSGNRPPQRWTKRQRLA